MKTRSCDDNSPSAIRTAHILPLCFLCVCNSDPEGLYGDERSKWPKAKKSH